MPLRLPPTAKQRVYGLLDRPVGRLALGLAASTYASLRHRHPVRIRYSDGLWIHRHPTGVLVFPVIDTSTPERRRADTLDAFSHGYLPVAGDVVVDVGAGYGDEALVYSDLVGQGGRVVSIEAHPTMFACLERTCLENSLSNVLAIHAAASDTPGEVRISDSTDTLISASIVNVEDGGILVDSVPLDVVARGHEIDRVDLVKMNIEGAESDALLGATDLLGRTSHAAISCHDFIGDDRDDDSFRTLESVERILTTAGFAIARRTSDPRPWIRDTLYASRKVDDEGST